MSHENTMRKRFHFLSEMREAIVAKSTPMRDERDAFVQSARAEEDAMNAAIREAEEGLYDIEMERGALARALKGQVGEA